jgi:hypothetical protein
LVPQGEILDHKVCAGEEGRSHGGEQQQTEAEHEATQDPPSQGISIRSSFGDGQGERRASCQSIKR